MSYYYVFEQARNVKIRTDEIWKCLQAYLKTRTVVCDSSKASYTHTQAHTH